MRFDPSLRVNINRSMEIATGKMENQVPVCGGNQSIVRGEICKATNYSGNLNSGSPKDRSSEW